MRFLWEQIPFYGDILLEQWVVFRMEYNFKKILVFFFFVKSSVQNFCRPQFENMSNKSIGRREGGGEEKEVKQECSIFFSIGAWLPVHFNASWCM